MEELIAIIGVLCLSCSRIPSWLDQKEQDLKYKETRSKRESCVCKCGSPAAGEQWRETGPAL